MTVLVSFLMSLTVYSMIYYYVIPKDLQSKSLSFFVSSEVDTKLLKGDVIKTIPSLKSVASIGNPLFGVSASGG
jgi:hypothetical protein